MWIEPLIEGRFQTQEFLEHHPNLKISTQFGQSKVNPLTTRSIQDGKMTSSADKLKDYCKIRSKPRIEDITVALGASRDGYDKEEVQRTASTDDDSLLDESPFNQVNNYNKTNKKLIAGMIILPLIVLSIVFAVTKGSTSALSSLSSTNDIDAVAYSETVKPSGSSHKFSSHRMKSSEKLPNFIYILADDLGWNALGTNDSPVQDDINDFAATNLATLAGKGVYFSSYYSQETCTPARASLLTGRYPINIGIQYGSIEIGVPFGISTGETFLSEVLSANGYTTYGLGKWDLGHFTPYELPTARGFDYYSGYLNGEEYYWSKRDNNNDKFHDFLYMSEECYDKYDASDQHQYSTWFYRDKAIDILENHDFTSSSLFLYLSFQAVHDPFDDDRYYPNGIPVSYVGTTMYDKVKDSVDGHIRRQYTLSLYLLDEAIEKIVKALDKLGTDVADNTYIIFASDNGGCPSGGGRSGPLRGEKGTLFEGGTKVDSFIYSSGLISDDYQGTTYDDMFHVSDWFPTILGLADISFTAGDGYDLDGYDMSDAIFGGTSERELLLYNLYYNVENHNFTLDSTAPFAIRNSDYKLIHAYTGQTGVYGTDNILSDDDNLGGGTCCQTCGMTGTYTKYLFKISEDPYEKTNLYDSDDDGVLSIVSELLSYVEGYASNSTEDTYSIQSSKKAFIEFKDSGNYIVPWVRTSDLKDGKHPSSCSFSGVAGISPDDIDTDDKA